MKYHRLKKFKIQFLVVTVLFLLPQIASAQLSSIVPDGLGIEIGIGHNQLFWQAEEIDESTIRANRTALSIMPSARIHYTTSVTSSVGLYTFFGYNEFGGHSEENQHSAFTDAEVMYKDRFRFQNLEAGIFGLYRISDFNVGLGAKVNHHLEITQRHHFQNHPQGQDGWGSSDVDFFFKDWSIDGGIRIEYLVFNGITLGGEGWFGISDLSDSNNDLSGVDEVSMNIRQNHFRFLLGYRF